MTDAVEAARNAAFIGFRNTQVRGNVTGDEFHGLLNGLEAAIRADERAKVQAVVGAARSMDGFIQLVDSGMTVFPFDPNHPDSQSNTYARIADALRSAVAALDESEGSEHD